MSAAKDPEYVPTIVVGGGQAGLAVGYHLSQKGLPYLILDANERVGDAWRKRWDSLRLFSPAAWNGLPGLQYPGPRHVYPTKDEYADFLESYATKYQLVVRNNVRVEKVSKNREKFEVRTSDKVYQADNVVVAMSTHQVPRIPAFAGELAPGVVNLHSSQYKNPSQLQDGPVLVVGAGNSGAEIALDAVGAKHTTYLSGRHPGAVPIRIDGLAARLFFMRLVRFMGHNVLTIRTPMGRKMRKRLFTRGAPLVRTKPKDLVNAGVERLARVKGVREGLPLLEDDRVLEVKNVIWCTGYRSDLSWVDLDIIGENDEPRHKRGVMPDVPGLYFVGRLFLFAMSSAFIAGLQRDAGYIVDHLSARTGTKAMPAPAAAQRQLRA